MARERLRRGSIAGRGSRIRLAGAWVVAILAIVALAAIPPTGSGGQTVALNVLVARGGTVAVQGPGVSQVCDPVLLDSPETGCEFAVAPGSTMVLTAVPVTDSAFSGWSRAECPGTGPCTVTLDQRADVVAMFTPVQVQVLIDGSGGDVTASPAPSATCQPDVQLDADLCWLYPAGADVALTATPPTPGDAIEWDPDSWCEPDGGDLAQPVCRATVTFSPHFVLVRFAGAEALSFPFKVIKDVRILKAGTGSGVVRGAGFDCGTTCIVGFDYGKRATVQATPDQGSRFVRWQKTCSTQPSCTFSAGQTTSLSATFDRVDKPKPRPLTARIASSSVKRRPRVVVLRLTVNSASRARVRLLKGSRGITAKTVVLRPGTTTIRLKVPVRVRAGSYRIVIVVTTATGGRKILRRSVRIPARRG